MKTDPKNNSRYYSLKKSSDQVETVGEVAI